MNKLQELLATKDVEKKTETKAEDKKQVFVAGTFHYGFFADKGKFYPDAFGVYNPKTPAEQAELEYQYTKGLVSKQEDEAKRIEEQRQAIIAMEIAAETAETAEAAGK